MSPSETRLVKLKVRAPKLANTRALWKVRCYLAAVGLSVRRSAPLDCAFEGMKLSGQGTALAAHCILQDQAYFEIKIINKGMSGPLSPRFLDVYQRKACMTAWRQSATLCRHLCVRCGAQGGTCCISISQRQQARRCVRCSETALVVSITFIICSWVIRSEQDGCSFDNDDVVVRAFHP